MNNKKLEPWQKAPVKIIIEAINHAKKQNEDDNLIAFLLLDVGAEMLLKTYLSLPKKVIGAITSDDERFNITRKGFHDVIEGVKNSRQGIKNTDLARIEFFHGIRNKLYHQGNGLTVPLTHLVEYIEVLKTLFKQLLKIDLDEYFSDSRMTKEEIMRVVKIKEKVSEALKTSLILKENLKFTCNLVIEAISPALLLPSYTRKFSVLTEKAFSEDNFTLVDGEVQSYKALPRETAARAEIAEWFQELITPLISDSKYYDVLSKPVGTGQKHHIEAISQTLGIRKLNIEIQKVPNILSVIYDSYFDLQSLYFNIVDIIIFDDIYFIRELDYMAFDIKELLPQFHDESDIEFWQSRLNSCDDQNKKLENFIQRIENWLTHNAVRQ
ncbi:hypothetical protein [Shewanella frigidimarina]|uniref:hypothetical protein n=1 Tax=Shewanella frigidimarina TaxID=56812 RepID=UPI003FA03C7D